MPYFISDVFGGRIFDKELVKQSGLCALLVEGDSVMADRGLVIEDLLPTGVSLNIPPFLEGREQLEPREVVQTRRIASVRILVECAFERVNNFQILSSLPSTICPIANELIFVCCFLTTFMEPLVPCDRCVV